MVMATIIIRMDEVMVRISIFLQSQEPSLWAVPARDETFS